MWLVPKNSTGRTDRVEIDPDTLAQLISWYCGHADRDAELRGMALVRFARLKRQWIACDCQGPDADPPLLAPACLSVVRTWYLRRLAGPARPKHRSDCRFRAQQTFKQSAPPAKHSMRPDKWFSAVDPKPIHLAQRPEPRDPPARPKVEELPRLGRLTRLLLERAGANRIDCSERWTGQGIDQAFAEVIRAARGLEIAPGVALPSMLFTRPDSISGAKALQELQRRERGWPKGHAAQAFVLVYARDIERARIITPHGQLMVGQELGRSLGDQNLQDDERAATRPPGRIKPAGPWLCLLAAGRPPEGGPYQILRAWAEPILSGRFFFPVKSQAERAVLRCAIQIGPALRERGVRLAMTRDLFDAQGETPARRRSLVLETASIETGRSSTILLQASDGIGRREPLAPGVDDLSEAATDPARLRRALWSLTIKAAGRGDRRSRKELPAAETSLPH
jgi:hypothetical protein